MIESSSAPSSPDRRGCGHTGSVGVDGLCAACLAGLAASVVEGTDAESSAATPPLGRYVLSSRLGHGGMGEIWRATDPTIGRDVAIKVIRGLPNASVLSRFVREARITGQLQHPNIVPVYELSSTPDGGLYMTMRPVDGETLAVGLSRAEPRGNRSRGAERLAWLQVFLKVCDAVEYAHHRGFVHRDLKPQNVMVGPFGEVLVIDWGMAAAIGDPGAERSESAILGTPAYMPPEQARGDVALDRRSDVYGLGAILYEILTGRAPQDAARWQDALAGARDGQLIPPRARAPERGIPWELEAVVLKAMAGAADNRYPTVGDLKRDIDAFLAGRMLVAARYRIAHRVAAFARQHRRAVVGISLGAALLFGAHFASQRIDESRRLTEAALHARDRFAQVEPELARAMTLRGNEHLGNGRLDEATHAYAEAIGLDPESGAAYLGRARARRRQGNVTDALTDYGRAVALVYYDRDACEERGTLRVELGAYREALQDFERLATAWPLHSWGHYYRGLTELILGNEVGAIRNLATAASRNDNEPLCRLWLRALTGKLDWLDGFVETPAPGFAARAGGPAGELGWLIGYFRGTLDDESLRDHIEALVDPMERIDMHTRAAALLAASHLQCGNESGAMRALDDAVATRNSRAIEYHWARETLRRRSAK